MAGTLRDKLSLLSCASEFKIVKVDGAEGYDVEFDDDCSENPLSARYDGERWSYFIGGCYNSGLDFIEIDMADLARLTRFCEMLSEDWG